MEKKHLLWYRIRGLDKMEARFGHNSITSLIKKLLRTQESVRVLEIGFGEGKCLLDLLSLFPDKKVELYGINNIKKGNMYRQRDFLTNASKFKLSIPKDNLPKSYFYDAGRGLNFGSNTFDLVISQVSVHYVEDKAHLIEEIWRVLKIGGKAFIHIDTEPQQNYPDFMKWNVETPLFVIYEKGKMVSLSSYLKRYAKKGYDIKFRNSRNFPSNRLILFTKNKKKLLHLNLGFDGTSTLNLTTLKNTDKYKREKGVWWGTRSVFYVKR